MPKPIRCSTHGTQRYALACCHLVSGDDLDYCLVEQSDDDPAQAWCIDCDEVLDAERGWTDRADAAADWKLICRVCFAAILERHTCDEVIEAGPAPD